jgi:hypothetical protein
VSLFASSVFSSVHLPPAFVIPFLRVSLCLFRMVHSLVRCSVLWGTIWQGHVGSSIILNLYRPWIGNYCYRSSCWRWATVWRWPVLLFPRYEDLSTTFGLQEPALRRCCRCSTAKSQTVAPGHRECAVSDCGWDVTVLPCMLLIPTAMLWFSIRRLCGSVVAHRHSGRLTCFHL